jgi:hypothetical protein
MAHDGAHAGWAPARPRAGARHTHPAHTQPHMRSPICYTVVGGSPPPTVHHLAATHAKPPFLVFSLSLFPPKYAQSDACLWPDQRGPTDRRFGH